MKARVQRPSRRHIIHDTLIVTSTVGGACALLIGLGILADALPAVIVAVAGFLAFCVAVIVWATLEGRRS
jgi:hypothetical protein